MKKVRKMMVTVPIELEDRLLELRCKPEYRRCSVSELIRRAVEEKLEREGLGRK